MGKIHRQKENTLGWMEKDHAARYPRKSIFFGDPLGRDKESEIKAEKVHVSSQNSQMLR
jgi:hypothetical protein